MSGFWIDVYDAAGAKENGTSINVSGVRLSEKANRIGQVQFTLPATDANAISAVYGKRYRLYSERNGYLGEFRHKSLALDADARTAQITGDDSLLDLANQIVGFNRSYRNTSVKAIVEALAALSYPTAWTVAYEPGTSTRFQNTQVSLEFQGESILTALDFVRAYMRGWFRRSGDTQITFGQFRDLGFQNTYYANSTRVGIDGTVALVPTIYNDAAWQFKYNGNTARTTPSEIDAWMLNVPVLSSAIQRSTQVTANAGALTGTPSPFATITRLQKMVDGNAVVNRVIPRGAGQGIVNVDLRYSDFSGNPYTIQAQANPDGSYYYYLEDTPSVVAYGRITRVLPFSDVRPITSSAADLRSASNALYVLSLAYLRKFKQPFEVYSVQCVNLPEAAEVGSVIILDYRGVALMPNGETAYLFVDRQPFFIIEKTTTWGESGEAVYDVVISSNGEGNVSTSDIFVNTLRDIEKFKARPEPTITYYANANPTLPVQAGGGSTPQVDVEFPFTLDTGVLFVNSMTLEMQLSRFTAFGISTFAADSFTVGVPPAGQKTTETQDITISGDSLKTQADLNTVTAHTAGNNLVTGSTSGVPPSGSLDHWHTINIQNGLSGGIVYYNSGDGQLYTFGGGIVSNMGLSYSGGGLGDHRHDFSVPPHQHPFDLPAHQHGMTHTHNMPGHTHLHDHKHALDPGSLVPSFGVFQAETIPADVSVTINGTPVTGWTIVQDLDGASTTGALCSGGGLFRADLTNYFPPPGTNIHGDYRINIHCATNGGLVFCRLLGRITVQPIAA